MSVWSCHCFSLFGIVSSFSFACKPFYVIDRPSRSVDIFCGNFCHCTLSQNLYHTMHSNSFIIQKKKIKWKKESLNVVRSFPVDEDTQWICYFMLFFFLFVLCVSSLFLSIGPCGGKTTGQSRMCTFFENLGWKVSINHIINYFMFNLCHFHYQQLIMNHSFVVFFSCCRFSNHFIVLNENNFSIKN